MCLTVFVLQSAELTDPPTPTLGFYTFKAVLQHEPQITATLIKHLTSNTEEEKKKRKQFCWHNVNK